MSGHFDRTLAKKLSQALEHGDMQEQASRIVDMLGVVTRFVDNLNQAEITVRSAKNLQNEKRQLSRKAELSESEELELKQIDEDIHEAETLKSQLDRCKNEVRVLQKEAQKLYQTLNRLR